jgi:hypothetical protein
VRITTKNLDAQSKKSRSFAKLPHIRRNQGINLCFCVLWKIFLSALYKAAFKEAVALVAGAVAKTNPAETVKDICNRLDAKYKLGIGACKKVLTRSTIY